MGSKAKLEHAFETFWPPARKALSFAGDDLKVWQLMDLDPLKTLVKGRLALIGDAAHPFLPCNSPPSPPCLCSHTFGNERKTG